MAVDVRRAAAAAVAIAIGAAAVPAARVHAAGGRPPGPAVSVRFLPIGHATWPQLAAGSAGQGVIEYYLTSRGPNRPSLVVWLENFGHASVARVYEAPRGRRWVPLTLDRPLLPQLRRQSPIIAIAAPQGWWSRGGLPDYNLRVSVFGPVYTMWGGKGTYLPAIRRGPLAFRVYVHGSGPGIPVWDDRSLVLPLTGGYIRASYAQTECTSPRTWIPGPSPLWPYVAYAGHFLQGIGTEAPPIVVDWATGTVTRFSEVVSLRNQSCSYGFYSNHPVVPGRLNHPDFEAPWGFYTLSGQATGLPNLVIRVDWSPVATLQGLGVKRPTPLANALLRRGRETVRYSWADHMGNQEFTYKVGMAGPRVIAARTAIMSGATTIVAPSYRAFPASVIGHPWPVVTFVATGAGAYRTSEGVYQWGAGAVGTAFTYGTSAQPDLGAFSHLPRGMRGEYRVGPAARRPWLYASPIDGRLHLLGAVAGLMEVSPDLRLVERNLSGGLYIDDWRLMTRGGRTVSRVDALDGRVLLYGGPSGVRITAAAFTPAAFTILPPTSPSSWAAFVSRTAPYQSGFDPLHLGQWTTSFHGPSLQAAHGSVSTVVLTPSGFEAVVTVGPGGATSTLPGTPATLAAGRYVMFYSRLAGRFRVAAAPPRTALVLTAFTGPLYARQPAGVRVRVRNLGPAPWRGPVRLSVGHWVHVFQVAVPAGGVFSASATAPMGTATSVVVAVRGAGTAVRRTEAVREIVRPSATSLVSLSMGGAGSAVAVALATLALTAVAGGVWRDHAALGTPKRGRGHGAD
jgi:hypothetical protein